MRLSFPISTERCSTCLIESYTQVVLKEYRTLFSFFHSHVIEHYRPFLVVYVSIEFAELYVDIEIVVVLKYSFIVFEGRGDFSTTSSVVCCIKDSKHLLYVPQSFYAENSPLSRGFSFPNWLWWRLPQISRWDLLWFYHTEGIFLTAHIPICFYFPSLVDMKCDLIFRMTWRASQRVNLQHFLHRHEIFGTVSSIQYQLFESFPS